MATFPPKDRLSLMYWSNQIRLDKNYMHNQNDSAMFKCIGCTYHRIISLLTEKESVLILAASLVFISGCRDLTCRKLSHEMGIYPPLNKLKERHGPAFYSPRDPYSFGTDRISFDDEELAEAVPLLNKASISRVQFKYTSLTDASAKSFNKLKYIKEINVLGNASITDDWMYKIGHMQNLDKISVIDTNISFVAAVWLAKKSNIKEINGGRLDGKYRESNLRFPSINSASTRIDWRFRNESEYLQWLKGQKGEEP